MLTNQDISFFLRQADKNPDLNDWEIEFIESIRKRFDEGKPLTEKQEEHLHRIAMK